MRPGGPATLPRLAARLAWRRPVSRKARTRRPRSDQYSKWPASGVPRKSDRAAGVLTKEGW
jgi:hypothetical protein